MAKDKTRRALKEAPPIIPPQSPVVFLPLTLSASVAFAREVDAAEQRYANHRYTHGATVGGVLGSLIQRGLR
jgi:hypothetical protein